MSERSLTVPLPDDRGERAETVRRWRAAADDQVLLDGFHAIKHALRFGAEVKIAITEDRAALLGLAAELAPDVAGPLADLVREVAPEDLRELLSRVHPTRTAALAAPRDRAAQLRALAARPRSAPVIVLDHPRNLGNVGAVVRLAAGFGATGVVTLDEGPVAAGGLDPWHPNVVRAAAGLHYATAVERLTLDQLPAGPLYALDPEGEDIRNFALPDDALLAFGSERHGISAGLRERADHLVSLPMRPQVSSYNLATSVAMTLFHWGGPRQEGTPVEGVGGGPVVPDLP
ncbi:TrmH family RNA methyltransferase [Streptomyces sp. NPDC006879]|uniref:TrmH family RNA methyltransferase n=1 Tax=Streptomyces sp. NPDC006879 TaxID=3364767 RepID=UPI0036A257E1